MTKPLNGYTLVSLTELHPSPNNPREHLTGIAELADSIKAVGLIQPIIVQKIPGHNGYQIVTGHRRHAAAKRLGVEAVPCIIRRDLLPDEELLTMLIENGQRAGLDPIEEARALNTLKRGGLLDSEIGKRIGRSQSYVSTRLALLTLPIEEQEELRAGLVTLNSAVVKARADSGHVRPRKQASSAQIHLGPLHALARLAKARCQRLGHNRRSAGSVGGIACGACWESVIRADERQHLNDLSAQRNRCVLCDTPHDPDQTEPVAS